MEGIYLYKCSNIQTTHPPLHAHTHPEGQGLCSSFTRKTRVRPPCHLLKVILPPPTWYLKHPGLCSIVEQDCKQGGGGGGGEEGDNYEQNLWGISAQIISQQPARSPHLPTPPRPPACITHSDILEIKSRPNPICTLCSALTQHYINGLVGLTWLRKKKKKKERSAETCYMSSMGTQVALLRRL